MCARASHRSRCAKARHAARSAARRAPRALPRPPAQAIAAGPPAEFGHAPPAELGAACAVRKEPSSRRVSLDMRRGSKLDDLLRTKRMKIVSLFHDRRYNVNGDDEAEAMFTEVLALLKS